MHTKHTEKDTHTDMNIQRKTDHTHIYRHTWTDHTDIYRHAHTHARTQRANIIFFTIFFFPLKIKFFF